MIIKKEKITNNNLKDYFEYERKDKINITKIISIVMIIFIIVNISKGLIEIKNMESYIAGNKNSHSVLVNSQKEMENISKNKNFRNINSKNISEIFDTIGVENIDSMYIEEKGVQVIGKSKDIKTVEKLMNNKILEDAYVKKIEGENPFIFEIDSKDNNYE